MTYAGHCTSNDVLGTGQMGVPGVPGLGSVQVPATVNGVFVLLEGLGASQGTIPMVPVNVTATLLPVYFGNWASDLLADNWAVVYPSVCWAGYVSPFSALYNDVANDAGHGARTLATILHWWDHVVLYCNNRWPGKKIAIGGFSGGGFHVLTILGNRLSTVIGGVAHCPATLWENLPNNVTPGLNYGALNWSGLDAGTTILNGVGSTPVMVSYGTTDAFVGYNLAGTGGTPVSNTDAIITNAVNAGASVTRNTTNDNHELLAADETTFMNFITTNIDPRR